MKQVKITFGIRDGDNEYHEAWVTDAKEGEPKAVDIIDGYFGYGVDKDRDTGKEGHYWLAREDRIVWLDSIIHIPRGIDLALGEYLSDWGKLSTDEVIAILRDEAENGDGGAVDHPSILVWEPHEHRDPQWLLDHIETCADNLDEVIKEVLQ
jgi:hypothetical protein